MNKLFNNTLGQLLVMMGIAAPSMLRPVDSPVVISLPQEKTRYFYGEDGYKRIDHRAMERNKYAPWGRGVAGGAAV